MIKRRGLPDEDELILCTVKKLLPHCAFVRLDEYESVEGMLHVSEVSLRGVRNIKDHLSEDKSLVCKVLKVNPRGEVDVSLKRVKIIEMKRKLNEARTNKRVYKLIEHAVKKAKLQNSVVKSIVRNAREEFGSLAELYDAMKEDGVLVISKLRLKPSVHSVLEKSFTEMLEQVKVIIKRKLVITCNQGNGIERIKKLLSNVKSSNDYSVKITYLGSPKYLFSIISRNYKVAENAYSGILNDLLIKAKKLGVMVGQVDK